MSRDPIDWDERRGPRISPGTWVTIAAGGVFGLVCVAVAALAAAVIYSWPA